MWKNVRKFQGILGDTLSAWWRVEGDEIMKVGDHCAGLECQKHI